VRWDAGRILLGGDKGLVGHLEEVHTAEHLDDAGAVERPLLDCEV
jgi:hypothetical protein